MDIEHLEAFALADDKSAALKQLIPGTEEYYFYHCLDHLNAGRIAAARAVLATWVPRHGRTARVEELERRLALLTATTETKASFDYLRDHLGIYFNHQREIEGLVTNFPETLDPELLSRKTLATHAYSSYINLQGFTDRALDWVVTEILNLDRLRHLLDRLTRPDYPQLVKLILTELADKRSGGFGSRAIHHFLLIAQLDELAREKPELRGNAAFVNVYLTRLQPSPDVDWENDPVERENYLERLWGYVERLPASFSALKANVLFHRLDFDRRRGVYDRRRFLTYLQLPRQASYVRREYLEHKDRRDHIASLSTDFRKQTLLRAVNDDTELVTDYLSHFFIEAQTYDDFKEWVQDEFLKRVFAVTKILAGLGDPERWYSLFDDPSGYQALKERVDLDLAPTNKTFFSADDPVTLAVDVKNVPSLVVKVFEINTLNYFLAHGREVDTAVDLDGLVSGLETVHEYSEPALRRVRRIFTFPELAKPGVYVVEFIGSGRSSRALIKKGTLRYLERLSAAGHALTVLDEKDQVLEDATIWIGGRELTASGGEIIIPYSTQPRETKILLRHGALTAIDTILHQAEIYTFKAGIYVDRESLLPRKKAEILIRPSLELNGAQVDLSLLEEIVLTIQTTDRHGISTSREVSGLSFKADAEAVQIFQVPEDLASVRIHLDAKVRSVSEQRELSLADSIAVELNQIDTTQHIEELLLSRTYGGYVVQLLGKTGEARPHKPINFSFAHRDFTRTTEVTLQTDEDGRIELGALADIAFFQATSPSGVRGAWPLARDTARRPANIHAKKGDTILIPWTGKSGAPDRREFSLLERRGGGFLRDCFEALSIIDGAVQIRGLSAGDYELYLKDAEEKIALRISDGVQRGEWVSSKKRILETKTPRPLLIKKLVAETKEIEVHLGYASKDARVHAIATRFVPVFRLYEAMERVFAAEPQHAVLSQALSHYVSGRDIGDEYRYILERRYARKFPGTMLTRPGLLLNPWATRKTSMERAQAAEGGAYESRFNPAPRSPGGKMAKPALSSSGGGEFANINFLKEPARVWSNLRADENGVVRIPRDALAEMTLLTVVAVDSESSSTIYRSLALPEPEAEFRDLRLKLALDPQGHFTEKKQATVLAAGEKLTVEDITTSMVERYDTLASIHRLLASLCGDAKLAEFSFLLDWPKLSAEKKREKYSELACHELSFFLSRKDPEFFESVIRPYLIHKRDKTFMDHYLLGDDLERYLEPWAYGRLNIVERILLAERIKRERGPTGRHVKDRTDLLPPDIERDDQLFDLAIKGRSTEGGGGGDGASFGFAEAQEQAVSSKLAMAPAEPIYRGGPLEKAKKRAKKSEMRAGRSMAPPAPAAAMAPMMDRYEMESIEEAKESFDDEAPDADADETMGGGPGAGGPARRARDLEAREQVRQLYRTIDKTEEWAENNYFKLRIHEQGPELVSANAFWRDYALRDPALPFVSASVLKAASSFTEIMLALAVLDLPFEAGAHQIDFTGGRMELIAGSRAVVFHQEIKPAVVGAASSPILISQNYFRQDDRYEYDGNEHRDKFVTGEMLVHVVYLAQVVLTNVSSSRQKLQLLMQIPRGALPVSNGFFTKSQHIHLEPYATQAIEVAFYFPAPGQFSHFPAHAAKNQELLTSAAPAVLNVVEKLSKVDETSWAWISQNADSAEVLRYLDAHNIDRLDLDKIAWRMNDESFYRAALELLTARHVFHVTLWSYAIKHRDLPRAAEYLRHQDEILRSAGKQLESPWLTIDPVERRWYEHLEYAPLVNARAHRLGKTTKILNDAFAQQYRQFLEVLQYRDKPRPADLMSATYYLLLQDRVAEALELLARAGEVGGLQVDYLRAYVAFHRGDIEAARAAAAPHRDHPVDRWRKLFRNVLAQLEELKGGAVEISDEDDRAQRHARLTSTQVGFDFAVEQKSITVHYQNLRSFTVNYYRMDIELLFSRQPFVQQQSDRFSIVRPNTSQTITVPEGGSQYQFELPAEYHSANVIVELVADGIRKAQANYAHELGVQLIEQYGQVRISRRGTREGVAKAYVKVYARMQNGGVEFYKDGYTDLRGAFDYATLSTDELDRVERFAILVMTENSGAVIREASPPKR